MRKYTKMGQQMSLIRELKNKAGFTLVELSIVLIIIGFLIAGISAGSSLVKTAEINSVISDFRTYQVAYNNFIARYGQAPGDYSAASTTFTWTSIASACNGNNDGMVGTSSSALELMSAMASLASASMISAAITYPGACGTVAVTSATMPTSKVLGGLYSILNGSDAVMIRGGTAKNTGFWASGANTSSTNAVMLGKGNTTTTNPNNFGIYTAMNAYSVDVKVDDGAPGSGNIRSGDGQDATTGHCISATSATATYTLTNANAACVVAMGLN